MIEIIDDIWKIHDYAMWIAVTTNGCTRVDSRAVMGRGMALEAAKRYPKLPKQLAKSIKEYGNHVFIFREFHLFTFPTKHDWRADASRDLIMTSVMELVRMADELKIGPIYLPRLGCGYGGLRWRDVKPWLSGILDDRFIVVSKLGL